MTQDPPQTLPDWFRLLREHPPQDHRRGARSRAQRRAALNDGRGLQPDCPVVIVGGTNGKGSTCALLETIYGQAGYRTGVYTSPHLVHFEERCRIEGQIVAADALLPAFADVERARRTMAPTRPGQPDYFEFTTLAIVLTLRAPGSTSSSSRSASGGRLDAVNIVEPACSIITSVDIDHIEFLGATAGRSAAKAGIMRTGRPVVVSDPLPPQSVLDRARRAIGADLWRAGRDFHYGGAKQWNWAGRSRRYAGLAYPALRGANQLVNAAGVLAAVVCTRCCRSPAQAVRNGLALVELPGRFQVVPGQPALVFDVAHNPHSVAALTENLDAMGYFPTTHAVFGAMADKDLLPMFQRVSPLVDRWYFCDLPLPRAATPASLEAIWRGTAAAPAPGRPVSRSPGGARRKAVAATDPADRIVVFGSFHTVGGVLQNRVAQAGCQASAGLIRRRPPAARPSTTALANVQIPIRRAGRRQPDSAPSIEPCAGAASAARASLLVLAGVIGFPLLFESQPRPVQSNFEIEIPSRRRRLPPAAGRQAPAAGVRIEGLDDKEELVATAPAASAAAPAAKVRRRVRCPLHPRSGARTHCRRRAGTSCPTRQGGRIRPSQPVQKPWEKAPCWSTNRPRHGLLPSAGRPSLNRRNPACRNQEGGQSLLNASLPRPRQLPKAPMMPRALLALLEAGRALQDKPASDGKSAAKGRHVVGRRLRRPAPGAGSAHWPRTRRADHLVQVRQHARRPPRVRSRPGQRAPPRRGRQGRGQGGAAACRAILAQLA